MKHLTEVAWVDQPGLKHQDHFGLQLVVHSQLPDAHWKQPAVLAPLALMPEAHRCLMRNRKTQSTPLPWMPEPELLLLLAQLQTPLVQQWKCLQVQEQPWPQEALSCKNYRSLKSKSVDYCSCKTPGSWTEL